LGYVEAVTINSILVKKLNIAVVIVAFYQLVGGTTAIKLAFKGSAVSCRGSRESCRRNNSSRNLSSGCSNSQKTGFKESEVKKLAVLIELLTCNPFYFSGI
jgi:hypothetical protein